MENHEGSGAAPPGPFALRGALLAAFLSLFLAGLPACATSPPAEEPDPGPGSDPAPTADDRAETSGADRILERLDALRATRPSRAAALADSAYFRWRSDPALRDAALRALLLQARALEAAGRPLEAAHRLEGLLGAGPASELASASTRRVARLRIELGQEPTALRVLLERGRELPPAERQELVARAASGMSPAELRSVLEERPRPGAAERSLLRAELARALALAGRPDEAREVAGEISVDSAPARARELARRVREGVVVGEGSTTPRIEVVLPLSGSLAPVGRLLRQGMEVALEAHRREGGDSVVVVFRDDASRPERSRILVREAEEVGATAIVGPARSAALAEALGARRDRALPLVSPTATSVPGHAWNGYSLWSLRDRERARAGATGRWLVASAGIERLGLLRPRGEVGRLAEQAFRAAVERAGGAVVASAAYMPEATTFEPEIRGLAARGPEAVYLAARDARTALQIAPQLSYFGMGTAAVAGGSALGEPGVIRRLGTGSPSLYVTAVSTDRGPDSGWDEFKSNYEKKYDRTLSDNVLPALGYDAMKAVLGAADAVGLPRRGALARALSAGPMEGATGRIRFRPGRPAVDRTVEMRLARDGELVAADPARLVDWIREARDRRDVGERRQRERAEERVLRWIREHGGAPDREDPAGGEGGEDR
jgi:ABC-type branched-subunit amino acid transport system substrate-binding protein